MKIKEIDPKRMRRFISQFYSHLDKRVRDYSIQKLEQGDLITLLIARDDSDIIGADLMGFSATLFDEEGKEIGVTVVKREYRDKGIGTKLLKERYKCRPNVITKVWEGNIASNIMCQKAGLVVSGHEQFFAPRSKEWRTMNIYKKEE